MPMKRKYSWKKIFKFMQQFFRGLLSETVTTISDEFRNENLVTSETWVAKTVCELVGFFSYK